MKVPICWESNHAREGISVSSKVGGVPLCLILVKLAVRLEERSLAISQKMKTYNDDGP